MDRLVEAAVLIPDIGGVVKRYSQIWRSKLVGATKHRARTLARSGANREYGRLEHFRTFFEDVDWTMPPASAGCAHYLVHRPLRRECAFRGRLGSFLFRVEGGPP